MTSTATVSFSPTVNASGAYVAILPNATVVNTRLQGALQYRINGGVWQNGHELLELAAPRNPNNPYFTASDSVVTGWTTTNDVTISDHKVRIKYNSGVSAIKQQLTGDFNGVCRVWVRIVPSSLTGDFEVRLLDSSQSLLASQSITSSEVLDTRDAFVDFVVSNESDIYIELRTAGSGDDVRLDWVLFQGTGIISTSLFGLPAGGAVEASVAWERRSRADDSLIESGAISGSFVTRNAPTGPCSASRTWYLAPNGKDVENDGSFNSPWFSFTRLSGIATPGDVIRMKDGEYHYTGSSERRIQDPGSATNYIVIQPDNETNPNVTILGSKVRSGAWTAEAAPNTANIYSYDATSSDLPNCVRFKTNDGLYNDILYTYRSKGHDYSNSESGMHFGMLDHPEPGWFLEVDAAYPTSSNHKLYVKLPAGYTPADGVLTYGDVTTGLHFIDAPYWKIERIKFKDFGRISVLTGESPKSYRGAIAPALRFDTGSDDCIVERCVFENAIIAMATSTGADYGGSGVAFQDNLMFAGGIWPMLASPLVGNWKDGWERIKNQPIETSAMSLDSAGPGTIVRRNTIRGHFNGIVIGSYVMASGSIDRGRDMDIHHNRLEQLGDDAIEFEGTACVNVRAWMNTIAGMHDGFSMSPVGTGPVWAVANRLDQYFAYPFKPGQDTADTANALGWKLLYHNTCVTTVPTLSSTVGSFAHHSNAAASNVIAINNIFQGKNNPLLDEASANGSHHAVSRFTRNAFYTTASSPTLQWETTQSAAITSMNEQSVQTTMNAAEPTVVLTDNRLIVVPFPTSSGALNEDLVGEAVSIAGITNIAGSVGKVHLTEPLDIGAFGSFVNPPRTPSPTATLPNRWFAAYRVQQGAS